MIFEIMGKSWFVVLVGLWGLLRWLELLRNHDLWDYWGIVICEIIEEPCFVRLMRHHGLWD